MSKWISVNDRLPKEGEESLVTGWDYNKPNTTRHYGVAIYKGGFVEFEYVTHWMPLPEAPK
jgi:hypothetical protein